MALEYWWMYIPATALLVIGTVSTIFYGLRKKKVRNGIPLANTARLRRNPTFARSMSHRRFVLAGLALILLVGMSASVLAASRPVTKVIVSPVKYTRDIVLCLDVSGSMVTTDISIIQKFKDIIKGFNGERVSMVVFNSVSAQVFPLTDDYKYVNSQLDYVFNGFYVHPVHPGYDLIKYTYNGKAGSLIGDGLTACTMSFNYDDPNRSRSIILATDNVPNGVSIVPLGKAAGFAENKKVKIYAINPGSFDYDTKANLPKQEEELRNVALSTGGLYFPLSDTNTANIIVGTINKDQTSAVRADPVVTSKDDPDILLWILVGLSLPAIILYRRLK